MHENHTETIAEALAKATHLFNTGDQSQAESLCREILKQQTGIPGALLIMGLIAGHKGFQEDAVDYLQQAVKLDGKNFQLHFHLANTLMNAGRTAEAAQSYELAINFNPDHADSWNNLGLARQRLGRPETAISCYQRVLQIAPDNFLALNNLGSTLKDTQRFDEAIDCFQQTLKIHPDFLQARVNMGNILKDQGKRNAALAAYKTASDRQPDSAIALKQIVTHYVIPPSTTAILQARTELQQRLELLADKRLTGQDPVQEIGATNFHLAYHGINNKKLHEQIAAIYRQTYPSLGWVAPHCRQPTGAAVKKPLRIGFLSAFLYDHTIGKFNHGIIKHLNREFFEVVVFRPPGKEDALSRAIDQAADTVVPIPKELNNARQIIAGTKPDILFYPEIGMDPFTYFMGFSRLAPVQCVTWGHPDTTGLASMDFFISSALLETDRATTHYTEKLLAMNSLPTCYQPPEIPSGKPARKEFGLPENAHLYICPQSLFKLHPDFDSCLGQLLARDSKGLLVLVEGYMSHWTKLLLERFRRTIPEVVERIRFLPRMETRQFFRLLLLADALLDPPFFGGGNTSYEAFACGVPIVTWPSEFMRGRVTLGCYKKMGIFDLVASNAEEYQDLALRLATDKAWHKSIAEKIRAKSPALYNDQQFLRELETFFQNALEAAATGNQ